MAEAYESTDIYLTFGKQAGLVPPWATIQTHGLQRDQFKVCVLSISESSLSRPCAATLMRICGVSADKLHANEQINRLATNAVRWNFCAVDCIRLDIESHRAGNV
jgi:hypothetical protein